MGYRVVFRHASVSRTYPCKLVGPSHFRISNLWSVTVAQIKKLSPFIFEFCFWEDPPTQSTGPQPIQLVPRHCFLQISQYRSLKSKIQKTISIYLLILLLAGL